MNPLLEIKTIILGRSSVQGVVLEVGEGTALVALPSGAQRVPVDIPVTQNDLVTVRSGRVISKRTGGAGGAIKVYQV